MLLRDALTRTRMWTCAAMAPAKACHVVMNRNRGGSVAIIAEKPLWAMGGFFKLSQQLTNGQSCFLTHTQPGFISRKKRVVNVLSRVFCKAKTWFYTFNGMFVYILYVCVYSRFHLVRVWPQGSECRMPPPRVSSLHTLSPHTRHVLYYH